MRYLELKQSLMIGKMWRLSGDQEAIKNKRGITLASINTENFLKE